MSARKEAQDIDGKTQFPLIKKVTNQPESILPSTRDTNYTNLESLSCHDVGKKQPIKDSSFKEKARLSVDVNTLVLPNVKNSARDQQITPKRH